MHRSRLTAIAIDVPAAVHEDEAAFWSGALGHPVDPAEHGDAYVTVGHADGLEVFVQRVGEEAPRYHLDVETDDVDAEVARLEALGATRVEKVRTWWVMRDPAGLLFCVVRPQRDDFPAGAATWD
jgi:catechol 2,3-dioxygenase-like lactoylglutathione lyase family enzyme